MEKIRVRFNEFEYKIYHNYCLRYYTALDIARRRSIRLVLELFEKGILPVGEHDLEEAFIFFSKKCDDLLADYNPQETDDSSRALTQFKVCGEIPFLFEDFEKIYRLIQKEGISPNYILVLATFSKIIEGERNASVFAINEHEKKKIESFALVIANAIRKRLGPGAKWEPALHELIRVVRKFNQESPYQKINQNSLFLMGPAVISHFDVAAGQANVLSVLKKYFEDSELAEFESFLNNKPFLPQDQTDPDISDKVIFEALKSISAEAMDPVSYAAGSEPGHLIIDNIPAVISPLDLSRGSDLTTQSRRGFTSGAHKIAENYSSRFDIGIGGSLNSSVILPGTRTKYSASAYMKPAILQYSLLLAGVIIIILFVITIGFASGIWNPVKNVTNSSTEMTSILSILAGLQKNATLAQGNNQTGYLRSPPVQTIISVQPTPTKAGLSSTDINKHFFRVVFGPNNAAISKPVDSRMSIALAGDYNDVDIQTLNQFTDQFNNYSSSNQFTSGIKLGEQGTIIVYLLPEDAINQIADSDSTSKFKDPKTGALVYVHETIKEQFVTRNLIYINSDFKGKQRTHWLLRGVLYELGFMGETNDYPDSIFYSESTNTTRLNEIDLKAVELMYGKKITRGMTSDRVKSMLLM